MELAFTLAEISNVLSVLARVESLRRRRGPRPLLEQLRRQGAKAPQRDAAGRKCLRRAIAWVDACHPGGGNCYRRALLETALDRGAAQEPLAMGFNSQGPQLSGHAWLGMNVGEPASYDVTFRV
jgi:hypothetical protein